MLGLQRLSLLKLPSIVTLLFICISSSALGQQVQKFRNKEVALDQLPSLNSSQQKTVRQALNFFQAGKFEDSIDLVSQLKGRDKVQSVKHFILGRNYLRMQEYGFAEDSFKKALAGGLELSVLYYEYAQVLYAQNELRDAKELFRKAYRNGQMQTISLYYLGHISQLLEEPKKAKQYYSKILKHAEADQNLQQISRFQLAEALLEMARKREEKTRHLVKNHVLPQLKSAYKIDPKSGVAKDIRRREIEIKKEFALDPNSLINGRPIPSQRWSLTLGQKLSYDDNITFVNDLPTTQATQRGSFISTSKAKGSYFWVLGQKRFVLKPELSIKNAHHHDRHTSAVYQNDTYSIKPSVDFSVEHKLFGKEAGLIFGYDYSYRSLDIQGDKEQNFFARSNTFSIAERIKLFDFGRTKFRFSKDSYRGHEVNLDKDTTSFSVDQQIILPNKHLMLLLFSYDQIDAEDSTQTSDTMVLYGAYFIPNLLNNYRFGGFLSYVNVDNYQDPLTENPDTIFSYGPIITKRVNNHFSVQLTYTYTNTTSDKPANQFTKHVGGLELKYRF